jgi:hypothetical protein
MESFPNFPAMVWRKRKRDHYGTSVSSDNFVREVQAQLMFREIAIRLHGR